MKIGIIGLGGFGKLHLKAYREIEKANVVAICDKDIEIANSLADRFNIEHTYSNYKELLLNKEIDAVSICVPTHLQAGIAIDAIKHDKHVLLEKPIATTLEESSFITKTAKEYNRIAMVGYIERFNPSLRRVKQLVKDGKVGELNKVSSRRASKFAGKPEWVWDKVGMMIHICGHDIDILRWLFDDEVEKVYAESGSFLRKINNQADNIVIILRFKKGGIGVVESSWTLPNTFPTEENDTRIDIIGSKGNMIINNMDQMIALCNEDKGWQYPGILRWPGGPDEDGGLSSYALKDELTHFIKCIQENKTPVVTLDNAEETLKVLLMANESIKKGVPIYME